MFYKIKDLPIKVINGGTPSTANPNYWNGDIPWITPKDLSNHNSRYISKGERFITKEGLNNSSAKLLPKNTILLTSRAPIGYLALAEQMVSTNQGFKSLVCDDKVILPLYMFYNLSTKISDLINISSGSTFLELSKDSLEKFEINIHDFSTQQHIVDIRGINYDTIWNLHF